jgi:hypothetical protein
MRGRTPVGWSDFVWSEHSLAQKAAAPDHVPFRASGAHSSNATRGQCLTNATLEPRPVEAPSSELRSKVLHAYGRRETQATVWPVRVSESMEDRPLRGSVISLATFWCTNCQRCAWDNAARSVALMCLTVVALRPDAWHSLMNR